MEEIVLRYGLAGVCILVLSGVCRMLYNENKALWGKLFEMQEARRQEVVEANKELSATMETFSQSAKLLTDKIVDVQRRKR